MEKPWHERSYPDDFKDWLVIGHIRNRRYLILGSPDKQFKCVVHLADNEISAVIDTEGTFVYTHPKTRQGARALLGQLGAGL